MIAPMALATLALTAAPVLADMHHHAGFVRARHVRRRLDTLHRRKPIGWGDATTVPSTVAAGSDDPSCTCWHQVAAGEVCLGLIDKSSAGFTLDKFFQLNPSLQSDCSNLVTGLSYCVDTGANVEASGNAVNQAATSVAAFVAAKPVFRSSSASVSISASASASASASTSSNCESEEDDDEDEEYDDQEEGEPTTTTSANAYKSPVQAAVVAPSSTAEPNTWTSQQQQQQQDTWTQQQQQQNTWTQQQQNTWTSSAQAQSSPVAASVNVGVGQLYTGTSTYYYQNGVAGSCGTVSSDSDYVAAVFTGAEYGKSNCGKQAKVTNTATGASIVVKVMDTCPTCTGLTHIDLSTSAFAALSNNNMGLGVLQTTWQYID